MPIITADKEFALYESMAARFDVAAAKLGLAEGLQKFLRYPNKEITLYIPVQHEGALFSTGDGHLIQGDGEVDLCGLESAMTGVFRLTVRKDMKLLWPRGETPTHVIAMGFHETLDEAARRATREMVEYLVTVRKMTPQDAYALCSMAVDLRVTQVVDGIKGVHAMVPKALFR